MPGEQAVLRHVCEHCSPEADDGMGGDAPGHEAAIRILIGCQNEEVATADCGCHLTQEEDGDVALFRCPTHEAGLSLDKRELATVLAALRLWTVTHHGEIAPGSAGVLDGLTDIASDGGTLKPLSDADIDLLIQERLNVGPSQ